jgi:general secretion pathway protein G
MELLTRSGERAMRNRITPLPDAPMNAANPSVQPGGASSAIKTGPSAQPGRALCAIKTGPSAQPGSALCAIKNNGYTLIEMIIVMAIISVLVAIAVPLYQKSLLRTKESLLKNNLFTLRTVIDEYTFDKQKAPQTLDDLANEGYLRAVPLDPITGSNQTWRIIMEDSVTSVNQTQPGIYDIRSGSDLKSLEGTPYSEW